MGVGAGKGVNRGWEGAGYGDDACHHGGGMRLRDAPPTRIWDLGQGEPAHPTGPTRPGQVGVAQRRAAALRQEPPEA